MIHRKVLEKTGCTTARLKDIFTCTDATSDNGKIRKRFEEMIQSRVQAGFGFSLRFARKWQAVDIAWDSTPIMDEGVPLMLWAQGKINQEDLIKELRGTKCAHRYIREEVKDGKKVCHVDIPKFFETNINLIRSYCTRGMAAQTARFSSLWPYFKYETRGTDLVSKLRGDSLSEYVDGMADLYNYRHLFPQGYRHMFMYARSLAFVRSGWDQQTSWRPKDSKVQDIELESYISREGVDFVIPHPSRVFWDTGSPLPNINTDNGPTYIGYWDIVPYGVLRNGDYFNVDKVSYSSEIATLITGHPSFFTQYFDPCVMKWPDLVPDPSAGNDRIRNIGRYSGNDVDKGCLLTQYFVKINPMREGISVRSQDGKNPALDCDVWMRLVVAGDTTIVAGEFLSSTPAAYGGINENDDRLINQSRAMELMAFQDQLTNLWTQMLINIKTAAIQIYCFDKDVLDPESIKYIETSMKGDTLYNRPHALIYSGSKNREAGIAEPSTNPSAVIKIVQANIQTTVQASMQAIGNLLNMVDRLMVISPNEFGQPNPREVSARETTEIASSTSAISSYVSDGIDEQRSALKRMIYEYAACNATNKIRIPVMDRYTVRTLREAGFEIAEGVMGENADDNAIVPLKTAIFTTIDNLEYSYYFDSRDGADRASDAQGAQIIGTIMSQLLQVPGMLQAIGKRRLFEWANEVIRMSGAAYDLKLDDSEDETIPVDGEAGDLGSRVERIEQAMAQVLEILRAGQPGAAPGGAPTPAGPPPALGNGEPTGNEPGAAAAAVLGAA